MSGCCGCGTCDDCTPSPDGWDSFAAETGFTGEKKDSAGRRICYDKGKRVGCAKKPGAAKAAKPTVDDLHAEVTKFRKEGGDPKAVAARLNQLTVKQLDELKAKLGDGKGGRLKAEKVAGIVAAAKEKAAAKKAPAKKAPAAKAPAKKSTLPGAALDRRPVEGMTDDELRLAHVDLSAYVNGLAIRRATSAEVTQATTRYAAVARERIARKEKAEKEGRVRSVAELRAGSSPVGGPVREHGMAVAEGDMAEKVVAGISLYWNDGNGVDHTETVAARSVANMRDHWKRMPEALRKATKEVIHTTQSNADDAFWEKEYNKPGFKSTATGGDGKIVLYNGNALTPDVFAHEAGHNLAFKEWGSTKPPASSEYGQAQAKEKPVTEYGAKSTAEDFAEACMMYADKELRLGAPSEHDKLKADFPLKYAALRRLIGDV